MKIPRGRSFVTMLAIILGMVCVQATPAQTFKRVKVKGGATLAQVVSGGSSVWARAANGHPYIFKGKQFVLANEISLCQLAVGGGSVALADTVWGLDCSGAIYTATKSGTTWVFSAAPGLLDLIAVGPGYNDKCHPYEVWGLHAASIYRFNYCLGNWDFVPGSLATLAVGGSGIWGINRNLQIFQFDLASLSFVQVPSGNIFNWVTVGPNGVWASYALAYQYQPGGNTVFIGLGPISFLQLQAGGNGVWGIDLNHQIYRLDQNLHFVQVPGALVSISVGSGGGVWGTDSSRNAYVFSTTP